MTIQLSIHSPFPVVRRACKLVLVSGWLIAVPVGHAGAEPDPIFPQNLASLRNPVWTAKDNLRDPSVLKTTDGYQLFYSRFSGGSGDWGKPANWAIASVFTKDFVHFTGDHDVSPKGFASPGDVVFWHGRYILPYQSYPAHPSRLCFSESTDLKSWSAPKWMLAAAADLRWNELKRVIDPTLVVDGDVLHCYFVGSTRIPGDGGKANLMGHAITRDPKLENWEILSMDQPMIGISARAPDGVENTMVIRTGARWTMIYSEGLKNQHLAMAESHDLKTWTPTGPVDIIPQQWMARKHGAPFIWRDGNQWIMILMGTNARDRTTFGLLSSADGKTWNPLPE